MLVYQLYAILQSPPLHDFAMLAISSGYHGPDLMKDFWHKSMLRRSGSLVFFSQVYVSFQGYLVFQNAGLNFFPEALMITQDFVGTRGLRFCQDLITGIKRRRVTENLLR